MCSYCPSAADQDQSAVPCLPSRQRGHTSTCGDWDSCAKQPCPSFPPAGQDACEPSYGSVDGDSGSLHNSIYGEFLQDPSTHGTLHSGSSSQGHGFMHGELQLDSCTLKTAKGSIAMALNTVPYKVKATALILTSTTIPMLRTT